MNPIPIEDLDDPRLAPYRALKATNETRGRPEFIVEGRKLVERLLAAGHPTLSILALDREAPRLGARAAEGVAVYSAAPALISRVVGFPFHQGVLAHGRRAPEVALDALIHRPGRLGLVICPRLSNPENLGAIARIADVFGLHALLVGPSCPDPFSRRVLRVSMGAVLNLPVLVRDDLPALAGRLIESSGIELWGAIAVQGATPHDLIPPPDRFALVMGEEDQGLDPHWAELCARLVTIPMRTGASSLNVAAAAAVLLDRLTRPWR